MSTSFPDHRDFPTWIKKTELAAALQVSIETVSRIPLPVASWGSHKSNANHSFTDILDYLEKSNPGIPRDELWPTGGRFLTEEEAAEHTGLTPNTFRMLGTRGKGPATSTFTT